MAVPDGVKRARRHQVDGLLPLPQEPLVDHEAIQRFAQDMEGRGKVIRAADGDCLTPLAGRRGHVACHSLNS